MQCKFSFVAEIINHAAYLRFLVKRTKLIFHGLLVLWSTCWCINSFHLFFTSLWWVEHLQNWMIETKENPRDQQRQTPKESIVSENMWLTENMTPITTSERDILWIHLNFPSYFIQVKCCSSFDGYGLPNMKLEIAKDNLENSICINEPSANNSGRRMKGTAQSFLKHYLFFFEKAKDTVYHCPTCEMVLMAQVIQWFCLSAYISKTDIVVYMRTRLDTRKNLTNQFSVQNFVILSFLVHKRKTSFSFLKLFISSFIRYV